MKKTFIKGGIGFSKVNGNEFSEEEVSEYSFKIEGCKLIIKNSCSLLKIKKHSLSHVKITMNKKLSGTNERELKDTLDSIYCEVKDEEIYINPLFKSRASITVTNIESIIMIPENIKILDIRGEIGDIELDDDYDRLDMNIDIGDLAYTGELKECYINSRIGAISLNLKNIKDRYEYHINKDIGDIRVIIPKGSKINIDGIDEKDINGKSEIQIDNDGAIFEIKKKLSNVTIESQKQ